MELSFEETLDIMLEIIGCSVAIGLIALFIHSAPLIQIVERLV